MTNRIHIDAPSGIIDIEGEKDFVEGMLSKLFPVLEKAGFGSHPQVPQEGTDSAVAANDAGDSPTDQPSKPKITRRRGAAPPKGHSCADRILSLKAGGFFKERKGAIEIVSGLRAKGWTHNPNQVGAATSQLFKKGELQRTTEGDGPWQYYWDRD